MTDDDLPNAYQVLASGEGGFLASTVWIRLADAEQDAHEWRINGKDTTIIPLYERRTPHPEGAPSRDELRALYWELLYAVSKKHPEETRHQTALRYIQQAEKQDNQPTAAGSRGK
jgi:hypothetical protein